MRRRGQCPCTDVVGFAEKHLKEVQRQIAELTRFEDQLTKSLKEWRNAGKRNVAADAICALIERTMSSTPAATENKNGNNGRRRLNTTPR